MRWILIIAAAVWGCSLNPPGQCTSDAQCTAGMHCADGICTGCNADAECGTWQSCTPTHLCHNLIGRCSDGADCALWQVCDESHSCALRAGACNTGSDCKAWETCSTGHMCVVQSGRCNTTSDCASAATGGTCSDAHYCAFAAGQGGDVLLFGTLSEGACGRDAISRLDTPTNVLVGTDCAYYGGAYDAFIAPSGAVVYGYGILDDSVRLFVPDAFVHDGSGSAYPASGPANDTVLMTPGACPNNGVVEWVMQAGTGALMYPCPGGQYYDSSNTLQVTSASPIVAWSEAGYKLTYDGSTFQVISPTGTFTQVSIPYLSSPVFRTHGSGFWVVGTPPGSSLLRYSIDTSGAATLDGTYADPPAGMTERGWMVIDSAGDVYEFGSDPASGPFVDIVIKRPLLPGVSTVPYSEKNATPDDWSVYPPKVYNKIHISYLVTTP